MQREWVGLVIHWELCKKFKFEYMNKWYMQNPESVQENVMHKILWDIEIQTDHLILVKQPDLMIVFKKKTCWIVDFAVLADHRVKLKKSKKRDKYPDLAREQKKLMVIPTVLLKSIRISKRVLTHSRKLSANAGEKNSQMS